MITPNRTDAVRPLQAPIRPIPFKSVAPRPVPGWREIRVLVDGRANGTVPGFSMAAGGLELPANFRSDPQQHPDSDTVLLFTAGGPVLTYHGENLRFWSVQWPGDLLTIPRGTPYVVDVLSEHVGATGYVVRSTSSLLADNLARPDLDHQASAKADAAREHWKNWTPAPGRCAVVPFESVAPVVTPQGHRIRPLVDGRPGGNTPGMRFSVGGLDVPGAFLAHPHHHPETHVLVLPTECPAEGALTLHGEQLEHDAVQYSGDLLPIPAGREYAHTVQNLSLSEPIGRVYEFRSQPSVLCDNPRLPELLPIAERRGRAALESLHGLDAVAEQLRAATPTQPRADLTKRPERTDWVMGFDAPCSGTGSRS
ncbi:aldehyde dehydrogenase (NAD+) [Lentzea xinjiangensis]|uniref:Aldehyde dehydrogenase (NAD+) n=1 Tax=Lentzea xinjiangensis TaxID=402600 RepID=A0A1H9WGF9_9PSEU|nr:aldehyde dehydrogenase (NAD+) [Lentzea xinjiangensis]